MDFLENIREGLRRGLLQALERAVAEGELPAPPAGGETPLFVIEAPRERGHGDFAANLALVLAGRLKLPPRRIAEALAVRFPAAPEGGAGAPVPVARVEVAGPGFLNFFMAPGWLDPLVPGILRAGAAYGRSDRGRGRRVQVEFVSANPTGPLNVVNARAGAFGDALAACLEAAGYEVRREFYVNDAGNQFALLGLAMEVRCRELLGQKAELPEGAYPGEYVIDLAREFLAGPRGEAARALLGRPGAAGEAEAAGGPEGGGALGALREELARFAVERIVAGQRRSLERYGVTYDRWARESEVRAAGGPERVLERLGRAGHLYERDGAVWFRSSAFGDDQDRVMVRRNGEHTYFLVDVAYHLDKFERGFDRVIDIWGQDHHGYVPRVRAALRALGLDASRLEVLLNQIVRLVRGGQPVRMSKRRGEFVTMDAFLDDVGRDAARFLFLMRSIDSHMDFDLDLARLQAAENPVYYVQYAHARVCSILRQAAAQGAAGAGAAPAGAALLREEAEVALLRKLAEFPGEVAAAAEAREPHRLTAYARDLATLFHAFYAQCRVLSEDPALTSARLALADAFRRVLANALALLGVSAPERM